MRATYSLLCLAALSVLAAPAVAVDLTKIDRSIRKEPVFESKDPQYCLLVFGPEAKARVWLVLDGDVLYLDRNGNGDLTEPGERIEPRYALHNSPTRPDMKIMRFFFLSRRVKEGKFEGEPLLPGVPDATAVIVEHFVPADDRTDAGADADRKRPFRVCIGTMRYCEDCTFALASRPGDAPILHFDGPRQFALHPYFGSLRRGETCLLMLDLRTPGLDASVRTFRPEGMEGIHPVAEIECPPRRPGAEPVRFRLELPGGG